MEQYIVMNICILMCRFFFSIQETMKTSFQKCCLLLLEYIGLILPNWHPSLFIHWKMEIHRKLKAIFGGIVLIVFFFAFCSMYIF